VLRTLATLAIPSVLVAAFSFGASTLVTRGGADESRWVNWGGRSFSSREELRGWLRARGLTYRAWATNHRYAAARLEGREPPPRNPPAPAAPPEEAVPAPAPAVPTQVDGAADARGQPTASIVDHVVLTALLLLTAGLIGLAVTPVPVLFAINAPVVVHERRAELLAAGIAIGAGVLAAQLLSA
jgi:hypothetical protein